MAMAGPAIEYGPVPYMTMQMPSAHIISRPAAKKSKVSLHAELDSFYSDLASLESSGAIPPAVQEQSSEQNNVAGFESTAVADMLAQPGPSNYYSQTASASVETEPVAAPSKPSESAPTEVPRRKKKVIISL